MAQSDKVVEVKLAELIIDWSLWPRHEAKKLDVTNIGRMKEALHAGLPLPPIVVDRKSMRVVDGFHRVRAHEDVYGDEGSIQAVLRDYENEAAMFLESGMLNNVQGLPLSPKDKAHFVLRARRLKIPFPLIAKALGMREESIKSFVEKRTILSVEGQRIPVGAGAQTMAQNLDGKKANEEQTHFARTCNGSPPMMHARMLLNALRAYGAIEYDEKSVAVLKELRAAIDQIIEKVAA